MTRSLSRFDGEAYSGRFRHDGELLVAGSERGVIKVSCHGNQLTSTVCLSGGYNNFV